MEAGFSRMNDLTVVQASQGLCAYLLSAVPEFRKRGVVIGHDHRHHSETFSKLTAGVFLSKGVKTFYYRGLVHTPLVVSSTLNRPRRKSFILFFVPPCLITELKPVQVA